MLKDVKVYYDGSHYIGIPPKKNPAKRKNQSISPIVIVDGEIIDLKSKFNEERDKNRDKKKTERDKAVTKELSPYFEDEEQAKEFIDAQNQRVERNRIVRCSRLFRKVRLLNPNYFCTFTYDEDKHTEESFREKLSNCLRLCSSRNDWKYIGVWERAPENGRLHFHGIFKIPEGQMKGELIEIKDYSTKAHRMQITTQNTYFNKRFGRSDFKEIDEKGLERATKYLIKYIEKSGERLVYSRGIYMYFMTDILEDDVLCNTGPDEYKVILADDFYCIKDGEVIGNVSPEVIDKMGKCN